MPPQALIGLIVLAFIIQPFLPLLNFLLENIGVIITIIAVIIALGVIWAIIDEAKRELEENNTEKLEEKIKIIQQKITELEKKRDKALYKDASQFRAGSEMYKKFVAEYHQLGALVDSCKAEKNRLQDKKDLIAYQERKNNKDKEQYIKPESIKKELKETGIKQDKFVFEAIIIFIFFVFSGLLYLANSKNKPIEKQINQISISNYTQNESNVEQIKVENEQDKPIDIVQQEIERLDKQEKEANLLVNEYDSIEKNNNNSNSHSEIETTNINNKDIETGLINALKLNKETSERLGESGKAIQTYIRKGMINKKPNRRFDYTDYYLLKKPAKFMGHDLAVIEEEYMSEWIGCCESDGAGVTVKVVGDVENLEQFAIENGCLFSDKVDLQQKLIDIGLKSKVLPKHYASLSCRERDKPSYN